MPRFNPLKPTTAVKRRPDPFPKGTIPNPEPVSHSPTLTENEEKDGFEIRFPTKPGAINSLSASFGASQPANQVQPFIVCFSTSLELELKGGSKEECLTHQNKDTSGRARSMETKNLLWKRTVRSGRLPFGDQLWKDRSFGEKRA